MICPLYDALTPLERVELIGKVVHSLQSDNNTFLQINAIVALAEQKGIFDNVIINPPQTSNNELP